MDGGPALICERHKNETRLSCAECSTPICPKCAVRTPVGFKCPDHATPPGGRRPRSSRQKLLGPLLLLALIAGALGIRQASISKPATFPCPARAAPDVGIGDRGVGLHWKELARSPLCGRFYASSAWTGTELLVWGGQNCAGATCPLDQAPRLADGAAYNPSTNKWRKMTKSPLGARDRTATVWTGKELLVWGGTSSDRPLADGAAYDPAKDRWRPIAASPLAPRAEPVAVWTGQAMVVWSGTNAVDGALYDPAADTWRKLAPSPLEAREGATAAWTGKEVLIWSGAASSLSASGGVALPDGAAYDPARDAWRRLPASPLAGRVAPSSVWTGQELVIWGGNPGQPQVFGDGAAYNPASDAWRPIAAAPVASRAGALTVWNGTEMVLWGGLGPGGPAALPTRGEPPVGGFDGGIIPLGDGVAFNPATNTWRRLERSTLLARGYAVGAWDGQGLIIWGGLVSVDSPASAADGARYVP